MSTNKNKFNNGGKNQIGIVAFITKHVTKSGKLKGKNKKETKYLKSVCVHFMYNKKGKLKPMFFNDGQGECVCKLCARSFPAKIIENKDVDAACKLVISYIDQATAGAVSTGVSSKTIEKFAETKSNLDFFRKKGYKKTVSVVTATDRVKNKKRKNRNSGNTSYGQWGSGRR